MMLGEPDNAIAELEPLIPAPAGLSPTELAADPLWAPLRDHPRFRELSQPGALQPEP